MLKKQEILAVYQRGPQAICDFVHQLENQIQNLKERIEVLENCSKKNSTNGHKPPSRLSDRVSALIRRIIPIKSKIRLHILKHAVFHQKSFNFLLFINISYDTEQYLAFTAYKI
ncbi:MULTISPECIES: hypothetical protein [unclassified Bacillus cereus group]|uniref:hypothetical protein n=1 Tax=unclassified Bacillus cereus group TaxID=2750818 RepID=UPI0033954EA0